MNQIWILDEYIDNSDATNQGKKVVKGVLWLTAPANRVRPNVNATTLVPPESLVGVGWGYKDTDLAALRGGTVVEVPFIRTFLSGDLLPFIKTTLEGLLSSEQAALNATATSLKAILGHYDGAWSLP